MPSSVIGATAPTTPTMSSLEIAKLTGKNHADVLRDIRAISDQVEGGLSKFADTHRNPQNKRIYPIYRLPRAECDLVISGYSVKYRWAIIKRWHEFEKQAAAAAPALPSLIPRRWLMTIDSAGREHASPVSDGAILLTLAELADAIAEPGALMPSNAELVTLAKACNDRLAMRLGGGVSARSDRSKGITRCPAG